MNDTIFDNNKPRGTYLTTSKNSWEGWDPSLAGSTTAIVPSSMLTTFNEKQNVINRPVYMLARDRTK